MTRTDKTLAAAVGLSVALHLAALFGTPRFDFDWRYEAPVPLELTVLTQPPVEIAPEPVRRPVSKPAAPKKRAVPVADAPRQPVPLPIVSTSLLDAPSPDGEPLAVAEAGAAPGTGETAALSTVEPATVPGVETKPIVEYPLKRARLVYDLYYATVNSGNGATRVGQLTHTWSLDGVRYEAAAVAEASGLVALFFDGKFVQRSTGQLGAGGLVPERYTLDRGRGDRVESAQFDWAGHKLALAWKTEARTVDLPVGALDPLSLMYQMYFVQPVPAAASVNVVTSRKLSQLRRAARGRGIAGHADGQRAEPALPARGERRDHDRRLARPGPQPASGAGLHRGSQGQRPRPGDQRGAARERRDGGRQPALSSFAASLAK